MNDSIFQTLCAPFEDHEIEWLYAEPDSVEATSQHRIFPYLKANAVRARLDSVLGPANWATEFIPAPGGMICKLSVRVDGEWIVKSDAATETDISPVSGASTRSFIRAASVLGVGRYLYDQPDFFAQYVEKGAAGSREIKFGYETFYHLPPTLSFNKDAKPAEAPSKPRLRPDVKGKPRFDQAPLGTKSEVQEIKNVAFMPKVNGAHSKALQHGAALGPDQRPFASYRMRSGMTKGKMLKDHTDQEISGLIRWLTVDLPNPTSAATITDRKNLIAFLGGKLEMPG